MIRACRLWTCSSWSGQIGALENRQETVNINPHIAARANARCFATLNRICSFDGARGSCSCAGRISLSVGTAATAVRFALNGCRLLSTAYAFLQKFSEVSYAETLQSGICNTWEFLTIYNAIPWQSKSTHRTYAPRSRAYHECCDRVPAAHSRKF
jgi:hypothetical protein